MRPVVQDFCLFLAKTGHWDRRPDYKPGPDGPFAPLRGHWANDAQDASALTDHQ
jgi:hypothetical protein